MSSPEPPDPSALEYLADDVGLSADELREWLRAEIERRGSIEAASPQPDRRAWRGHGV